VAFTFYKLPQIATQYDFLFIELCGVKHTIATLNIGDYTFIVFNSVLFLGRPTTKYVFSYEHTTMGLQLTNYRNATAKH
jgi:hypothetical protein